MLIVQFSKVLNEKEVDLIKKQHKFNLMDKDSLLILSCTLAKYTDVICENR